MWLYHWYSEKKGWPPSVVDELTLDQAFWLPVMKEAQDIASEQLADK